MAKMTHKELHAFLLNIDRTMFIGITAETSGANSLNATKNATRKAEDNIKNDPNFKCSTKDIVKFSHKGCMITPLSFKGLVENRNEKDVAEVLEMLQISTDDLEKQAQYNEWAEAEKAKDYDVSKAKAGETLSGGLRESYKDEHPMIIVYNNSRNIPQTDFYLNDELIEKELLKPYKKKFDFDTKYKKQLEWGLSTPIDTQNYRFENIRSIAMNGETYEIVPD